MASQAWADFGKKTIAKAWPGNREGVLASLIYCVVLTIVIFIVIWLIHQVASIDYKTRYELAAAQLRMTTDQLQQAAARRRQEEESKPTELPGSASDPEITGDQL